MSLFSAALSNIMNSFSFALCCSRSTQLCLDNDPPTAGGKFVCANVGKTCVAATAQGTLPNAAARKDPILQRLVAIVERKIRKRQFGCGIDEVQSTAGIEASATFLAVKNETMMPCQSFFKKIYMVSVMVTSKTRRNGYEMAYCTPNSAYGRILLQGIFAAHKWRLSSIQASVDPSITLLRIHRSESTIGLSVYYNR
mmetsp:Transcript_2627/g.5678  ORF Transcript_2627/g.5678 Transcript_2627/m.5678 type:complete len:197 (-) Transcript_2627:783-1373(-)